MSLPLIKKTTRFSVVLLISWLGFGSVVYAGETDCLMCHADIAAKKIRHAAIEMGCTGCHSEIDASHIPHKITNKISKGLSSEQPDLCFGCHDKSVFTKKTVHAALGMGCTTCHNPHASDTPKLLVFAAPELCFNCHDKTAFGKKNVHVPVSGGLCITCHDPHSSDDIALVRKKPLELCLDCHSSVEGKPHAIRGFANAGHPLGRKDKKDPKRPDRKFYCGSCHDPHSSNSMKLFRYDAKIIMGICKNCHTY